MEKRIDNSPPPNEVNLHGGSEALNFAGASGAALPPLGELSSHLLVLGEALVCNTLSSVATLG